MAAKRLSALKQQLIVFVALCPAAPCYAAPPEDAIFLVQAKRLVPLGRWLGGDNRAFRDVRGCRHSGVEGACRGDLRFLLCSAPRIRRQALEEVLERFDIRIYQEPGDDLFRPGGDAPGDLAAGNESGDQC